MHGQAAIMQTMDRFDQLQVETDREQETLGTDDPYANNDWTRINKIVCIDYSKKQAPQETTGDTTDATKRRSIASSRAVRHLSSDTSTFIAFPKTLGPHRQNQKYLFRSVSIALSV
jgi:hypothetical protein